MVKVILALLVAGALVWADALFLRTLKPINSQRHLFTTPVPISINRDGYAIQYPGEWSFQDRIHTADVFGLALSTLARSVTVDGTVNGHAGVIMLVTPAAQAPSVDAMERTASQLLLYGVAAKTPPHFTPRTIHGVAFEVGSALATAPSNRGSGTINLVQEYVLTATHGGMNYYLTATVVQGTPDTNANAAKVHDIFGSLSLVSPGKHAA